MIARGWTLRRRLGLAAAAVVAMGVAIGCGGQYKLPTELPRRTIPIDKSYQMLATWDGLGNLQDVLLSQGLVFTLYNSGGTGTAPRGHLDIYPLARPSPIPNDGFPTLFNPIALAVGGDGTGRPRNRLFVLDQGDSCLARANPTTGMCDDTTGDWNLRVRDLALYWHVREFALYGGDTLGTFSDTTVAWVRGVGADDQGRVYVSCLAIVLLADPSDPRRVTRSFLPRVYRYLRGPRYPGVNPPDWRMPGSNWHRDTTWVVEDGSGIGTIQDAYGIEWGSGGGHGILVTDYGKNWIQKISDAQSNTGFFQIGDSGDPLLSLYQPTDVSVDESGYIYICDTGNSRIMRHDPYGVYVQRVDVEPDAHGRVLQNPIAVTANDSLVYVADRGLNEIIRYKRRS